MPLEIDESNREATPSRAEPAIGANAVRWRAAQRGEAVYWEHARGSLREQARILAEKMVALDQAIAAVPTLLECHGPKVEVGIGPMGIGMLHFLSTDGGLVGVDPLTAIAADID